MEEENQLTQDPPAPVPAPAPAQSSKAPSRPVPAHAVFIGREVTPGTLCMNGRIYRAYHYYDKEGNEINVERWKPGEDAPEIAATERTDYYPGDLVDLPLWDETLLEQVLATGNYAYPDAQDEIKTKMDEAYQQDTNTTNDAVTYKRLMKANWNDWNSRGLIILPQGDLNAPKREGA